LTPTAIAHQTAITKDNVTISIDGVLYVRVVDPFKASYGVDSALYAVSQLAQTTMRSELGRITLDKVCSLSLRLRFVWVHWRWLDAPSLQPSHVCTPHQPLNTPQYPIHTGRRSRSARPSMQL